LFLPLVALVFVAVMIPVKVYALITLNKQGWITRTAEAAVAEGQGSGTFDKRLRSVAGRGFDAGRTTRHAGWPRAPSR
jgi:N-acetylglucosaminyltransferase